MLKASRLLRCISAADALRVLGVEAGAPADDVKRNYRRLAKQYHPDNASGGDRAKFDEVHGAYEHLKALNFDTTAAAADAVHEEARAAGFDPTKSARRQYVSGHEAAMARAVCYWCAVFCCARFALNRCFPPPKTVHVPIQQTGDVDHVESHSPAAAGVTIDPLAR